MKIYHLNYFDNIGGSGRAGYRIHQALCKAGVESRMFVKETVTSDWTVQVLSRKNGRVQRLIRDQINKGVINHFHTIDPIMHSPDIFSSVDIEQISQSEADIVHLHWLNSGMLSVADIGKLKKPIIWTLHDMWAFCGAEHYSNESRWKEGYRKDNRPNYESGFDLNRWTWERKRKHWKYPIHIITPSRWLAKCVQQSSLMHEWPVTVIPYAIDTTLWQPYESRFARQILNLPADVPLLLFGAIGGGNDPRKGFDLLKVTLSHLRGEIADLELIVFGQSSPQSPPDLGFPVHYTGHLHDDVSLRLLYNASDLMIIPSRLDNLPNTGLEAHACGVPVAAFNVGGLSDIVKHLKTGYLAKPFDTIDLAQGIKWILDQRENLDIRQRARERAVEKYSESVVAEQYLLVYQNTIDNSHA